LQTGQDQDLESNEGRLDDLDNDIRTTQAQIDELKIAMGTDRDRIDHLPELLDVFTQTQPAPTDETVLWLEP
jgi:archaellum component FlaC